MKHRNILIILGVVVTLLIISFFVLIVLNGKGEEEEKPTEIVELASIPEYGYVLEDRDTEVYKDKFESLRDVLTKDEVDYDAYASLLAELYIIDLYTISNKMNHYDIGGLDFIPESSKDSFTLKVQDTIYKYIEDNSYGKRNQELPEVASITSSKVKEAKVKLGEKTYDGYELTLNWEYVSDLGYDTSAKVTLAKIDDKLFITNQSASE